MRQRDLLDPELAALLPFLPNLDFETQDLTAIRAGLNEAAAQQPPVDSAQVKLERRAIPGSGAPDVRLTLYTPAALATRLRPAVLHFHSGGYVVGDPVMDRTTNAALAADLDCVIVSVDYRLAPETPHPGPLNDAATALRWLVASSAELGVDPAAIGLKGESAGGGLAAALALHTRDNKGHALAFLHLTYPMLDDRTGQGEEHPHVGRHVWTAEHNRFAWRALLGDAAADAYAAPARAADLTGLPPTYIGVGALDLFADEDIAFARRLVDAGVPTELHVYPGAFHGFDLAPEATRAIAARRDSLDALRRMVANAGD